MTTVHVIDDDERSRKLASDVLAAAGFRVLQSGSAAMARAQLSAHGADLVLLDIQLPDEDGFQVMRWIREHATNGTKEEVIRWNNGLRDKRISELDMELQEYLEDYIEECLPGRVVYHWFDVYDIEEKRIDAPVIGDH